MNPFHVKACALIVRMDGQVSAINLRELRNRVENCSPGSIYHHFCETQLRPTFDDPEFTNDFATWAYRALRDDVLAERLGILDPDSFDSIESLRAALLDILEDRLADADYIRGAELGHAFYFMTSSMLVFDTGLILEDPEDSMWALRRMTRHSIYYHFVETRAKFGSKNDNILSWLREGGPQGVRLAEAFSSIDVEHYTLRALRQELLHRAHSILGEDVQEP